MKFFWKGIITLLSFSFILISCEVTDKYKIEEFPIVQNLKGEKINTIDPYMLVNMDVIDTFLIIVNSNGNNIIQIYSTVSNLLVKETGKIGQGPGEFLTPQFAGNYTCNESDDKSISIYDCSRRRYTKVNVIKTLDLDSLVYKSERLPNDLGYVSQLFYKNDSVIYYEGEGEGRFSIYNTNSLYKKRIPYITPKLNFSINKDSEYFIFKSQVSINISKNVVVATPLFLGQIDFFNLKGEYLHSTVFEEQLNMKEAFQSQNITKADAKRFIVSIKSDVDFIYTLNGNIHNKDLGEQRKNINTELLIFNWQGKPIKKIQFDRRITRFAVDAKNQCVYGYSPYESDWPIIKYEL